MCRSNTHKHQTIFLISRSTFALSRISPLSSHRCEHIKYPCDFHRNHVVCIVVDQCRILQFSTLFVRTHKQMLFSSEYGLWKPVVFVRCSLHGCSSCAHSNYLWCVSRTENYPLLDRITGNFLQFQFGIKSSPWYFDIIDTKNMNRVDEVYSWPGSMGKCQHRSLE